MFFKRIFYFWSLICVFVLLLCCVFILFNAFWYFLVLLVLLVLFVLLKSYREKKFKTDLITSFILLRPYFIYNVKKEYQCQQACRYYLDPIFSSNLWALSVRIFHFCISRPSKFGSIWSPLCIMFLSLKCKFICHIWHLEAC